VLPAFGLLEHMAFFALLRRQVLALELALFANEMRAAIKTVRFAIGVQIIIDFGVPKLCRKHGMSNASFYKWRTKYGGIDVSLMGRMKELEAENARLKKMYADVQLQNDVIKEAL
jgi:Transposase